MKTRTNIAITLFAAICVMAATGAVSAQSTRYYDNSSSRWMSREDAPQTRARQVMPAPDARFDRQQVRISTNEKAGTIIVDTDKKFLYFVEGNGTATRYGVGVGKEGFTWAGTANIGRKAEWPGWTPPAAMRKREAAKGRILPAHMEGGPENPLGARALYLYRGGADTMFRIHGTNQPWTIGQNMSSGCIRMMNEDVTHLYERAGRGTKVIVIGPNGNRDNIYAETGSARQAAAPKNNIFAGIFGTRAN